MLGFYTRLSRFLIKRNTQRANPFTPIPSPTTGWTNWPINEIHISKLNWRQFFPCHNIHLYYTFIVTYMTTSLTFSAAVCSKYTSFPRTDSLISTMVSLQYMKLSRNFVCKIRCYKYICIEWRRTGSNPVNINRFRSHTAIVI